MRKAAAVFCLTVALGLSLFGDARSGSASSRLDRGEPFALAEPQDMPAFTLTTNARKLDVLAESAFLASIDPAQLAAPAAEFLEALVGPPYLAPASGPMTSGAPAVSLIAAGLAGPGGKRDSPSRLALAIFMGRGNGDPFSSLHETYAWRAAFKTMNLGAGLYRDIPITRILRIKPYLGIIRSYAIVRPSSPYAAESASFESRLTAVCIGLPLVCGF
jgi:hypothetical protein